ncbi:recombinase family protein [Candidatus Magnetaquicoccus inordinatus]|uniref:recombinase family protein n=1 Tax=Candidatus Magnetaquicoccus inordinatus TaxID=2496818 RepID=UPI00102CD5FA|nr:recombinase family protein [Candidatus Magnetaquicoccus inordinatus]
MQTFAYLRVSTSNQTTENQLLEIAQAGYQLDLVYADTISGSVPALNRPEFAKMMDTIKRAKTAKRLIVSKLDRLGRDAVDVLSTVRALEAAGCTVRLLQLGDLELTSPAGKIVLTTLAAVAEMEKDILIERTHAGLSRAKKEGKSLGRPKVTNDSKASLILQQLAIGTSVAQVAREQGVSRQTVMRIRDAQ